MSGFDVVLVMGGLLMRSGIVLLPSPLALPIMVGRAFVRLRAASHRNQCSVRERSRLETAGHAKLDIDLPATVGLHDSMDEGTRDLIAQPCARAAMVMEDVVLSALAVGSADLEDLGQTLDILGSDLARAAQLLPAARALVQQSARSLGANFPDRAQNRFTPKARA